MIGVIPLPAVRKRIFFGGGSGSTKSPCGGASRTMVPGATPRTRCWERKPSGCALMVTERWPASRLGGEVREYDRQWKRPSTCTAMPTYWPGWWSKDQPQPGLMTSVAASSVSGTTLTILPRSSRADHSGLSSVR